MKITGLECLHADAGQRNLDVLKISTDEGLVGWSEYIESFGGKGVTSAIAHLAPPIVGRDPRAYEAVVAPLQALRRQASGGMVQQAIGAIENALLDVKALDVPVYELFGGPVRERVRLHDERPLLRRGAELPHHGDRSRHLPWYDELVTVKPRIENGYLLLPDGPGWGMEVDEQAVRAHPPQF